ncbi:hypothetical protein IPL68_03490 [Candidatus Saccharibacteria bacterium]|nr:MAG: hypothetical protein IPL68_03490 [Candidatus Saccharibacteria bacterium]
MQCEKLGDGHITNGDFSTAPPTAGVSRLSQTFERLCESEITNDALLPKEVIATGSNIVRDGQIGVIKSNTGFEVSFKLTDEAYADLESRVDLPPSDGTIRRKQPYKFLVAYDSEEQKVISSERVVETGTAERYTINGITADISHYDPNWQALNGLVTIMVPNEAAGAEAGELASNVDGICRTLFGCSDVFQPPDEAAEALQKN